MSWRDTVKRQSDNGDALIGRFRQARFVVPSSTAKVGRRAEVHEYPLRSIPWVEDIGRAARHFEAEVFVDGTLADDYLAARNALITALETPGPGTLVHPWYGTMTVSVPGPTSVRETNADGGRATFRITFVESGALQFPAAGTDTQEQVDAKAVAALAAATESFEETFDSEGLPGWALTELQEDLRASLTALESNLEGITSEIAAQIRAPANMAASITGSMYRLADIAGEPLRAIQLYEAMFDSGLGNPTVPLTTPLRRQQAKSTAAQQRLIRQAAVVEASRSASKSGYASRDDALDIERRLGSALDSLMEEVDPVSGRPVDDQVYAAMQALRAALNEDLRQRGARLPDIVSHIPTSTLPALVIAHQLYGDATRDGEIIARNKLMHPGFTPGGTALEVLNG